MCVCVCVCVYFSLFALVCILTVKFFKKMMQIGFPEFVLHDCVFIELVKCKVC